MSTQLQLDAPLKNVAQKGLAALLGNRESSAPALRDNSFTQTLRRRLDSPPERPPESRKPEAAPSQEGPAQPVKKRETQPGPQTEGRRKADTTPSQTDQATRPDNQGSTAQVDGNQDAAGTQGQNTSGETQAIDTSAEAEQLAAAEAAAAAALAVLPAELAVLQPLAGALQNIQNLVSGLDGELPTGTDGGAGLLTLGEDIGAELLPDLGAGLKRLVAGLVADDSAGKSLQNSFADAFGDGFSLGSTDLSANASKMASLVAQLQSRGAAGATAFTDSPAKAMQALQGEAPARLQSVFSPRAPNPLQAGPQLQVTTPVGQNGWAEEVGNKVIWLTNRGESKAELIITPPNLGKVEVSINMNGDQATAHFVAATREAKEALEQALPRLRELMQQAGISLGDTSVNTSSGQGSAQEDSGSTRHRGGAARAGGEGAGDTTTGTAQSGTWSRQAAGLVDIFA